MAMPNPARTLAIETASEACSVALFDGTRLLAYDHQVLGRGHAEALVPMIAALPDRGRAQRICVSLGPGSFTGVRIGIAAARALGFAWKAQVVGYPTLALVAISAPEAASALVTVAMNGGHGEFFVQNFDHGEPVDDVQSLRPDMAKQARVHDMIVGNRAAQFAQMLGDDRSVLDLLPDARKVPLLHEARFTQAITPIYGRPPDAIPQTPPGSTAA